MKVRERGRRVSETMRGEKGERMNERRADGEMKWNKKDLFVEGIKVF